MSYNSFPYTNMHELNLDYLLNKSKEVQANVEASAGSASAAASSAAAAARSADASLTYSRNSANSAAASESSAADSAESARIAAAAAGDPVTFTAATQLTDTSKIYVYVGETGTYTYGHWYYYKDGAWIDGGIYGTLTTDTTLTLAGAAADAKATGDLIRAGNKIINNSVVFDKNILTNSGFITGTGKIGANASLGYSDIMEIPIGASGFTINRHGNFTGSAIAFFNEKDISESTFISGVPSLDNVELYADPIDVPIPNGAKYFAFSSRIDTSANYDFNAQINFNIIEIANELAETAEHAPSFGDDVTVQNSDLTTAGKFINTNGTQASNNAFSCSNMYEIPENAKEIVISASGTIPTGCAVAYYYWPAFDTDAFISGVPISSDIPSADAITVKIPDGALYVAFSGRTEITFLATITIKKTADFIEKKSHAGEYLSILGDSISSYQGYIPVSNQFYYPQTYLSDVDCTWWKRLLDATGMQLLVNNSWSGALMSGTSESTGLNRCENLDDGTNNPDHIIVFMGVNDFKYPRELGECGLNNSTYAVTNYSDAYYTALNRIRSKYPAAKLYLGTIMEFNYPNDGVAGFPIINGNDVNLIEFNNAIRKLADLYGAKVIEFTKCGITFFNKSTTLGDTAGLHPNAKGHYLMFKEALKYFND